MKGGGFFLLLEEGLAGLKEVDLSGVKCIVGCGPSGGVVVGFERSQGRAVWVAP